MTMTSDVKLWCDDFVFQIDTNTNPMRYRTRATWWRSRPAHNLQRSNGAGPPCHPRTPPKAAQPNAQSPQPVKKRSLGMPHLATPRGKGRKGGFSPPRDVRFLCASLTHKARSLSTRLGPARPLGTRRGDGRSLIQANRRSDPHPRFRKHVLGLRLSATPSDHALRPRLSHAFQPRLSATLSGRVFRRAIRVEDVVSLQNDRKHFAVVTYRQKWGKVLGYSQLPCADANLLPFLGEAFHDEHFRRISRTERSPFPCLHAVSTMRRASFHVEFRIDTLLFLYYAGDGDKSCSVPYSGKPTEPVPYSGKPTFVTLQDPRPRLASTS